MKASLDTNAIIHFYRAGLQNILFSFFDEGLFIYEQIRNIELYNHCKDLLPLIDNDIALGKIKLYTDNVLAKMSLDILFKEYVNSIKYLFTSKDLGEVFAIALANVFSIDALVTDDVKQGGPYMSLLQFEDSIMPFNFVDILILRYLDEDADAVQTVSDFSLINKASNLNWSFVPHLKRFLIRFFADPYTLNDVIWIKKFLGEKFADANNKFKNLKQIALKTGV